MYRPTHYKDRSIGNHGGLLTVFTIVLLTNNIKLFTQGSVYRYYSGLGHRVNLKVKIVNLKQEISFKRIDRRQSLIIRL